MKTKLLTLLFAIVASIGTMIANGTKIGYLYYNLNSSDKTAEITWEDYYPRNYTNLTVANIPSNVQYSGNTYKVTGIGIDAFIDCQSLTSVDIGENVINIGSHAFSNCTNLTSISFPNSLTSIGMGAFSGCRSLTSIIIGENCTEISFYAFDGCNQIRSITCYASWPPTCYTACFNGINKAIPVYVPAEALNYYKAADEWKDFLNIQAIQEQDIKNITIDSKQNTKIVHDGYVLIYKGDKVYTIQGQEVK